MFVCLFVNLALTEIQGRILPKNTIVQITIWEFHNYNWSALLDYLNLSRPISILPYWYRYSYRCDNITWYRWNSTDTRNFVAQVPHCWVCARAHVLPLCHIPPFETSVWLVWRFTQKIIIIFIEYNVLAQKIIFINNIDFFGFWPFLGHFKSKCSCRSWGGRLLAMM